MKYFWRENFVFATINNIKIKLQPDTWSDITIMKRLGENLVNLVYWLREKLTVVFERRNDIF